MTPLGPAPGCRTVQPSVGDSVLYRYSGSYTDLPVELEEQVVAQRGLQLEIDVHARRGEERRHWVQIVTDTPYNRERNIVDALYLVRDGERHRLSNEHNRDLLRCYEWTYLEPDGSPAGVVEDQMELRFAGRRYVCRRSTGRLSWHGHPIRFVYHRCPEFPWYHGPGWWEDMESGEIVWQVGVVEVRHVSAPA